MMHNYTEFKYITYVLLAFGLYHVLQDRKKKAIWRYLSFSYCLIRTFFSIFNIIIYVVILFFGGGMLTYKLNVLLSSVHIAMNVIFLLYLFLQGKMLTRFIEIWGQSRMTFYDKNSKCINIPILALSGLLIIPSVGVQINVSFLDENMYSFYYNTYYGPLLNVNSTLIMQSVRSYLFMTACIFDTMATVLIPIWYLTISLVLMAEFSQFNKLIRKHITSKTINANINIIEEHRLRFEMLFETVQAADKFLCFYLGINLFSQVGSVCFVSYNIITNWHEWSTLMAYVGYHIIILYILVGGSSIVSYKVWSGYIIKFINFFRIVFFFQFPPLFV